MKQPSLDHRITGANDVNIFPVWKITFAGGLRNSISLEFVQVIKLGSAGNCFNYARLVQTAQTRDNVNQYNFS